MTEFLKKKIDVNYKRNVESMGKGLVLIKIEIEPKTLGQNYHLFYGDKRKPPLDIAINPHNNIIEYISFFVQNEKVIEKHNNINIQCQNESVLILDGRFTVDKPHIDEQKEFDLLIQNKDIYVIEKSSDKKVSAYRISDNNYILVSDAGKFYGLILKNLERLELKELKNSDCI